jgi:hypothetical protein
LVLNAILNALDAAGRVRLILLIRATGFGAVTHTLVNWTSIGCTTVSAALILLTIVGLSPLVLLVGIFLTSLISQRVATRRGRARIRVRLRVGVWSEVGVDGPAERAARSTTSSASAVSAGRLTTAGSARLVLLCL